MRAHRIAVQPRTVAFTAQASVQDHGERMPVDCRFEVIYWTSMSDVAWRFFATRAEADAFVEGLR